MSPDVLEPLRRADPVPAAPDPASPAARAVLLRARAARPRRSRRPVLALAAVAAALSAAVLGGGSPAPVSARATVMAAADRTADFTSGQVTWRSTVAAGDYRAEAENVLRFDGDRTEMVSRSSEVLPSGTRLEHGSTMRTVDGRTYLREDTEPGARFRDVGRWGDPWVAERQRAEVSNAALIALVRDAEGVERTGDTYRATVPAAAFDRVQAGPPPAPVPLPAPVPAGEATLELTLAEDGTIRRLVVERPGQTQSFEWSRLGEPQAIEAP